MFTFVVLAISYCCSACAANLIFILDHKYTIVADNAEWKCILNKTTPGSGKSNSINGQAVNLPLSFNFFSQHQPTNLTSSEIKAIAQKYLSNYAINNNLIITDFHLSQEKAKEWYKFNCSYIDNNSYGYMQLYIEPFKNDHYSQYMMLMKIQGDLLDANTREILYNQTLALITPLFSSS